MRSSLVLTSARTRTIFVIAAGLGLAVWAVVVGTWLRDPGDGMAYWYAAERIRSGLDLYDPGASVSTPFAYWYPPFLAQLIVPFTFIVGPVVYLGTWTAIEVTALIYLVRRRPILVAIAPLFLPVAVELMYRNVHLALAALVVVGIRRSPALLGIGALVKAAPVVVIVYLACRRRYRDAAIATGTLLGVAAVSIAVAPDLWSAWWSTMTVRDAVGAGTGMVPIPYAARLVAAAGLAAAAGRRGGRYGDSLAAIAVVLALPTWWTSAFATLLAAFALWPRERASIAQVP